MWREAETVLREMDRQTSTDMGSEKEGREYRDKTEKNTDWDIMDQGHNPVGVTVRARE